MVKWVFSPTPLPSWLASYPSQDGIDNLIIDTSDSDGVCASANFVEVLVDCVAAASDGSGSAVVSVSPLFQIIILMGAVVAMYGQLLG
jgi:hypothetical protein